jgi:betaine-aldehyde dehydrogenase
MSDIAMNWIDGEWSTSANIATSINPANGEVVGQFADGGEAEAEANAASLLAWHRRAAEHHAEDDAPSVRDSFTQA